MTSDKVNNVIFRTLVRSLIIGGQLDMAQNEVNADEGKRS